MASSDTVVRIAIGSDHGGVDLKTKVVDWLGLRGYEVADMGTHTKESCDYPTIGAKVAQSVSEGSFDYGVLICRSGIGMAITANKVTGVRAGVCQTVKDAQRSRQHNHVNILVLGADDVGPRQAKAIVDAWFDTPYDTTARHQKRVEQINALD